MDRINIKNLEVFGMHGVFPEERALGQKFIISATLYADLHTACMTDDLNDSIDYSGICKKIRSFVEENTFSLIEAVAGRLAWKLLTEEPLLRRVWVEVKKPWAAIGVQLDTVSVEVDREWHCAYIALGSNIGNKKAHLDSAVGEISNAEGCRLKCVSEYIETEPYGFTEQDAFLNGCLVIETLLDPHELLRLLNGIEDRNGRVRDIRWGPRTLDLDIIYYDDIIMSDETLRIPHAEAHKREFVLQPLSGVAPYKMHPVFKKTTLELLNELRSNP